MNRQGLPMQRRKIFPLILMVLIAAGILLVITAKFLTDLWWFQSLHFEDVFWTTYETEYGLWVVGFLTAFVVLYGNVALAFRASSPVVFYEQVAAVVTQAGKYLRILFMGIAVILSFIFASMLSSSWMEYLQFLHAESFGVPDPVFGNDVGFYVFSLPFLQTVRSWLLGLTVFSAIGAFLAYLLRNTIAVGPREFRLLDRPRRHFAILASLFLALVALGMWWGRYDILFSTRSAGFFGAGYTDIHAQLPASWIETALTLLAAGMVAWTLLAGHLRRLLRFGVIYVALMIIVAAIYPFAIQKFIVTPNEQSKETPYIARNIAMTRLAYDLNHIEEKDINPQNTLTATQLAEDSVTLRNIMLWDYRPLASTLDQLQVIRLYYEFPDVDIDRYHLGAQGYRQVMLSARELNQDKLPANAQTWVNQKLVYTHGFGVGMSPVNVVTEEGLPEFFVRDIPPVSPVGISITRPEIYFGEKTEGHVILKGNIKEFDYPMGDQNVMTTYREDAGVPTGSLFRRLLFAIRFSELNMLISGYVAPESRILFHRAIQDRVTTVAPFLYYDHDPYMTVSQGRLYWIYDAYTTTSAFPYSKPYEGEFNYIRNSVKIVIDAYNGQTTYYAFDPKNDAILRMYMRIFPTLFKPIASMPEDLRAHVRYPQDLFDVQASMYATYHMTDPQVFYNKEDVWNIANEKQDNQVIAMESYYTIMRLPGEKKEEFILMLPYTPNKRDNMMAWLCARSDGEQYGKRLVYKFPKQDLTYGPMQVASRTDQDPVISQQLTLWNQQGSKVTRGNLLVIPIKQELLYVQPVYLQATTGKLPELKRVIVSFGNRIAMEPTLDEALLRVFGAATAPPTTVASSSGSPTPPTSTAPSRSLRDLAREASRIFERAQQALKEGDWTRYGEEQKRLRQVLTEMQTGAR